MIVDFPKDVPHDGSVDVTAAVNAWFAAMPNGTSEDDLTVVQMPYYGRYLHGGTIQLTGKSFFQVNGRGCTFLDASEPSARTASHLAFTRCTDWTWRSTRVVGLAPATLGYDGRYEAQHGYALGSCQRCKLVNVRADAVWGDHVNVGSSDAGKTWCEDWSITDSEFGYAHRQALSITAGRRGYSARNDWGNAARSMIDCEPNTVGWGCDGFLSRNDRFGEHRLGFVSMGGGRGGDVTGFEMHYGTEYANRVNYDSIGCTIPSLASAPNRGKRADIVFDNVVSTSPNWSGGPGGAVFAMNDVSGSIQVTNCVQRLQPGRTPPMKMVRASGDATVVQYGNTPDLG